MECQKLSLREFFYTKINKFEILENLSENLRDKLFLNEIINKSEICLNIEDETEYELKGTIKIPFEIKFTTKNYGIENK